MIRPRRGVAFTDGRYRTVSFASALAPRTAVGYRHGAMTTIRFSRTVVLGGVTAATFLIATAITALRVHSSHRTWIDDSSDAAYVSAAAFAEATESWLERRQQETVQRVADVMVSGAYRYIRVVIEGDVVLFAGDPSALDPDALASRPTAARTSLEKRTSRWILNVWVPLARLDGFVETVQDVTASRAAMVAAALPIGAAGYGAWAALAALTWIAGRRIARRRHETAAGSHLQVDPRRKSAHLDGTAVRLSPKQFALLALLASEEGTVFSDEDILTAVWPESVYADSGDIRQCVYQLRRRLDAARPGGADHVRNEKGFGYSFAARVPVEPARAGRPSGGRKEGHDAFDRS